MGWAVPVVPKTSPGTHPLLRGQDKAPSPCLSRAAIPAPAQFCPCPVLPLALQLLLPHPCPAHASPSVPALSIPLPTPVLLSLSFTQPTSAPALPLTLLLPCLFCTPAPVHCLSLPLTLSLPLLMPLTLPHSCPFPAHGLAHCPGPIPASALASALSLSIPVPMPLPLALPLPPPPQCSHHYFFSGLLLTPTLGPATLGDPDEASLGTPVGGQEWALGTVTGTNSAARDRAAACGPLAQSCLLLPAPSLLLCELFSMMLWEEEGCKKDSPQLVPALHPLIFFYTAVWLNHA